MMSEPSAPTTMLVDSLYLHQLPAVGLDDLVASAALLRRVDRKYLLPVGDAQRLVDALVERIFVLEIAGRRSTSYRSTYFDTAELDCFRDHLQGRRRRWKVRTRLYVEDALCRMEVKQRTGRGETRKLVRDVATKSYGVYGADEERLVAGLLGDELAGHAESLSGVLEVTYTRATLSDPLSGTRITVDADVVGSPVAGAPLTPGHAGVDSRFVIVETKGFARPSTADRVLLGLGHRPRALSKYVACVSALSPQVAGARMRRGGGNDLHVSVARDQPHVERYAS